MRPGVLIGGLALLVAILFVAALALGETVIDPRAMPGLLARGTGPEALILGELRLPRAVLALAIGAALGTAGAVLQGLLRNPLAEPGVLGISSSAGLGAVVVIYFGLAAVSPFTISLAAVAGALLAVVVIYALAGRSASAITVILAGVALSSCAIALTSLALSLAPSPYAVTEIAFWLLGSLADRSWQDAGLALPLIGLGLALLLTSGRGLDALTLGEEAAATLGIAMGRLKLQAILGTALAVGGGVAVSGGIGFVGLVVPHLLRPLTGHEPGRLLLPSLLAGAALVLAADIAVRFLGTGRELHIGVLTALLGAPFFAWLVLRTRRSLP
jgi:iron complex transport system permease protein